MPLHTLIVPAVMPFKEACCAASTQQANGGSLGVTGSHVEAAARPQGTSSPPAVELSPRSVRFSPADAAAIACGACAPHRPQKPGGAELAAADELVQVCPLLGGGCDFAWVQTI